MPSGEGRPIELARMDTSWEQSPPRRKSAEFATTRWSLVAGAAGRPDREADAALALLCERYWPPLYAFVRGRVRDVQEAQDLTQEFFARLLEKQVLAQASPERGRFRSFLLASMKNFLANQWDRSQAARRGGGRPIFSLDVQAAESRLVVPSPVTLTPDQIYERSWALTLLEQVATRLRSEFVASGKERQFELLKAALSGDREKLPFAEMASTLGISEDAARQAASRLRKRYREVLKEEVAQTVADFQDVDDEIRCLFAAVGR